MLHVIKNNTFVYCEAFDMKLAEGGLLKKTDSSR